MNQLPLSSFEIQGFRAFSYLKIEKLKRVNLFVGKNNVGKTSLLEAFWVYANQGSPLILWSLLEGRNEGGSIDEIRSTSDAEQEELISSIRYLFHGRKELQGGQAKMDFGPVNIPSKHISVKYTWIESISDDQGNRRTKEVDQPDTNAETIRGLSIQSGKNTNLIRFSRLLGRTLREQFSAQIERPCIFLTANGLSIEEVGKYWDNIALSSLENDVLDIMKIIEPDIERITLIGSQKTNRYREDRIPIVKVSSFDSPIPLRSLGEGMNRMFGLALAMVNTKGGILIVDEIESGLHYSVMAELWRFLFKTAERLDVQIFATTHSWDCITGFQQAAQESGEVGMMIRLMNKKGKITPTFFDEKDLSIATREQIEVR
jgi:predicted ATPase